MTLEYDDLFLRDMRIYDNVSLEPKKKITKRFICPTWRYSTARLLISTILQDKDAYLSWYFKGENILQGSTWAKPKYFEKNAPELNDRVVEGEAKLFSK